jgi:hypothetical protein
LSNWWTQEDARRFEEKARCIQHFYSSFSVDGHHVNGDLTLGTEPLVRPRLHYRLLTLCPAPTDPVPRAY